jgi:hypothetical protein
MEIHHNVNQVLSVSKLDLNMIDNVAPEVHVRLR